MAVYDVSELTNREAEQSTIRGLFSHLGKPPTNTNARHRGAETWPHAGEKAGRGSGDEPGKGRKE